ncbi:MAG: FliO/MopB family protein [Planctomycetales bacterium]
MIKKLRWLIPLLGFWMAGFAVAADEPTAGASPIPPRNSSASLKSKGAGGAGSARGNGGWTTMGGALVVVVGLILITAKLLKQRGGALPGALPVEAVQALGRRALDDRHALHLVRCGNRLLVLGTSPEGMRTLAEITDPGEVESLVAACETPPASPLSERFGHLFGGSRAAATDLPEEEPANDPAVLRLRERLQPGSGNNLGPGDPLSSREVNG